jgi:asparagine synthase (glutamine-hydrolysing)
MYWEATAKLAADMLVKVDRMSMAASLEVRSPLLDHELAALAMRMPPAWTMREGKGKYILLDSMRDRLPEQVWNRPKQGFAVPLVNWFRTSLREFLHDHLASPRFFSRGIVRPKFVKYLLAEHDSGRRNNSHWLFNLLMLELWFRANEDALLEARPEAAGAVR